MDFYSAYAQGFARVAAFTLPVTIADPAANAAAVLEQARACHDDGVAVAVFPELCLTGYAIDDLLLQDAAARRGARRRSPRSSRRAPTCCRCSSSVRRSRSGNRRLQLRGGDPPRARSSASRPKSYLPNYREFYERRLVRPGRRPARRVDHGRRARRCRSAPTCSSAPPTCPGSSCTSRSARTCGCRCPPSAEAALAGATVLANLSGSPITVARAEDRRLLVRSASARCLAAYVYAAAGQGESTTDLSWDGQTMVYEVRRPARRERAVPRRAAAHASPTSTSTGSGRSGCGRAPSTTTGARSDGRRGRLPRRRVRPSTRRPATSACGARSTASRSCPTTPSGSRSTATRPTTSRSPGSSSGSRAIGEPKVVIGVTGGLDSTHALIVAAKAMDRLGRPRSDIHAFTMPGFATGDDAPRPTPPGSRRRSA